VTAALLTEPDRGLLLAATLLTLGAAAYLAVGGRVLTPRRVTAPAESAAIGAETPAVANLLTSGFVITPNAAIATLLDLIARGWLRIAAVDDEVVVLVDRQGRHGDTLNQYEQQVLNHVHKLSAGMATGVSGAGIEVAGLRLPRRWWRRFTGAVTREARRAGLVRRRWNWLLLVPPAAALVLAGWLLWRSVRTGGDAALAESLLARSAAVVLAVGIWLVARRVARLAWSQAQRPTRTGRARAAEWMALRAWMAPRGFDDASSVAAANPSRALAYACAFGLAERAAEEVPIVPEDDRVAWSNASPVSSRVTTADSAWHVVRVRYPFRPGYGRPPIVVLLAGLVVGAGIVVLQRFLLDVSRGYRLAGLIDDFPDQADLIHDIAVGLAAALLVPLAWMAWLVAAGAFDLFATVERGGLVVRARRPQRVVPYPRLLGPLARRDRYSLFVAVDDGRSERITAWLATERTAVPQGAHARVRATPALGYVRSSEPIGTRQ
jgi:hypothetical protein